MSRRHMAELALPTNDALLALLTDLAFDPLILTDEDGLIVAANRAARVLFAPGSETDPAASLDSWPETEPEADLSGQYIGHFINGPELEEMIYCAFSDDNDCPEMQLPIRGHTFRVFCQGVGHGGRRYLALALQDVTQLLRLNRARRDMVANISHELRTPISAIRLLNETLNRQRLGKKQRQKIGRKIGRELDTLQHIIEGMRDLSMIESGQAIMRLVETPVRPLVEEALERLDEQIERQRLQVTVDVPEHLYTLADTGQIGRVLTNLIHNAIKFTSKKDRIHIQAEATSDDTVTVRISDSGPGIPESERERVFERFYQMDEARSAGRSGSGLGLAIAKHIVAAHGGQVWIGDSDLGGACLCFTLPGARPPAGEPASESADAEQTSDQDEPS